MVFGRRRLRDGRRRGRRFGIGRLRHREDVRVVECRESCLDEEIGEPVFTGVKVRRPGRGDVRTSLSQQELPARAEHDRVDPADSVAIAEKDPLARPDAPSGQAPEGSPLQIRLVVLPPLEDGGVRTAAAADTQALRVEGEACRALVRPGPPAAPGPCSIPAHRGSRPGDRRHRGPSRPRWSASRPGARPPQLHRPAAGRRPRPASHRRASA